MKKLALVVCAVLVAFCLGCEQPSNGSEEPANSFVGTWKSDTWIISDSESPYNGQSIYLIYSLENDNSFTCDLYASDIKQESGFGTYSIPSSNAGIPSGATDSLDITYGQSSAMREENVFYFLNGILYGGLESNATQYTKQ